MFVYCAFFLRRVTYIWVSQGLWLQRRIIWSLNNSLHHHSPLSRVSSAQISLENQTECFHLHHSLAALRDLTCWSLLSLPSGIRRCQLVSLISACQKALLQVHLAWSSTSSWARYYTENGSFAFTKPKQNWKQLFVQLFPALGKVGIDVDSSRRKSLRCGWERELVDLESWGIILSTQKVYTLLLLNNWKTTPFPDNQGWLSFFILYHVVLYIVSLSSYSMPGDHSHWQELYKNSHKFTELPHWVQAVGSKYAQTNRADASPQGVYRPVEDRQVNRYLQ